MKPADLLAATARVALASCEHDATGLRPCWRLTEIPSADLAQALDVLRRVGLAHYDAQGWALACNL